MSSKNEGASFSPEYNIPRTERRVHELRDDIRETLSFYRYLQQFYFLGSLFNSNYRFLRSVRGNFLSPENPEAKKIDAALAHNEQTEHFDVLSAEGKNLAKAWRKKLLNAMSLSDSELIVWDQQNRSAESTTNVVALNLKKK